ncbi:MAG TPA: TonB-dependent receptor [Thermoanaerobaculia bacterium]|nr:TonB-dependent receptor [Thermoanaerobaculia bacterium]
MGKRKIATRFAQAAGAALLLMAMAGPAPARGEVAVTAKGGTLGAGVELTVGIAPQWNVRLGGNAFNYTDDHREVSGIFYDATARLRTASALLDFHPGGGGFRLSAGAIYNDTRIDGNSLVPASGLYDIGGVQVPSALVGTLDGQIKFDPVVPYVGLGWGNAVGPGRRLRFAADVGAMFQGKGKVTLTPQIPAGSPLNDPIARAALQVLLDREEADIEKDVADYTVYPVVSIGISYRF